MINAVKRAITNLSKQEKHDCWEGKKKEKKFNVTVLSGVPRLKHNRWCDFYGLAVRKTIEETPIMPKNRSKRDVSI